MRQIEINLTTEKYTLKHPWPEKTFIQCGKKGVVLKKNGSYVTAFLEAFPLNTFIRGEGFDLIEAEDKAWSIYQKYLNCEHDFIRENESGKGKCSKCEYKKDNVFENQRKCSICNKESVNFSCIDNSTKYLCYNHYLENIKEFFYKENEKIKNKSLKEIIIMTKNAEYDDICIHYQMLYKILRNIKGYEELTEKEKYDFCNEIDNQLQKYINYFLKFIYDKVTKDIENKEDFNFIIMDYILLTDKITFNFLYEKIILNFENSFIKKRFLDSLDDYPEKYIKDLKLFK